MKYLENQSRQHQVMWDIFAKQSIANRNYTNEDRKWSSTAGGSLLVLAHAPLVSQEYIIHHVGGHLL